MQSIQTIGIIGYGRFGRLLYKIFSDTLPNTQIKVHSRSNPEDHKRFFSLEETASSELVIPATPINVFETTLKQIMPYLRPNSTVMDVCSVKLHPKNIMLNRLPESINIITTHPMFGPATYTKLNGKLDNLNFVIENVRCDEKVYGEIKDYWNSLNLNVVEMDAGEHDRLAARFHFITQFTAHILKQLDLKRSIIDTKSASVMFDFIEMIGTDKQLLKDMYQYNPYCEPNMKKFSESFEELREFITLSK